MLCSECNKESVSHTIQDKADLYDHHNAIVDLSKYQTYHEIVAMNEKGDLFVENDDKSEHCAVRPIPLRIFCQFFYRIV